MKDEKCRNCRFFKPIGDIAGVCRRYPPDQDGNSVFTIDEFPTTRKDGWCGEFKKGAKK